jgi:L-asparaginase
MSVTDKNFLPTSPARSLPLISYIATGGTIAMKQTESNGGAVPAIDGQALVNQTSELNQYASLEVDNFSNIPSSHFTANNLIALHRHISDALAREEVTGVIVSHGTDTMEETGFFLGLTLNTSKPVVLFGAQRSACEEGGDGPDNLLDALRVAVSADARDKGVMIVMNHQISAARDVSKTHTTDLDSFQSEGSGFLGSVDGDQVIFNRSPARRQHIPLKANQPFDDKRCRVDIVPVYIGADDLMIKAAMSGGARGIVIQALGAGNVTPAIFTAICEAIEAGVRVVIASRVPRGNVQPIYGYPGGGQTLAKVGALFAGDLSPQKARILLMLALQESFDGQVLNHNIEARLKKLFQ